MIRYSSPVLKTIALNLEAKCLQATSEREFGSSNEKMDETEETFYW